MPVIDYPGGGSAIEFLTTIDNLLMVSEHHRLGKAGGAGCVLDVDGVVAIEGRGHAVEHVAADRRSRADDFMPQLESLVRAFSTRQPLGIEQDHASQRRELPGPQPVRRTCFQPRQQLDEHGHVIAGPEGRDQEQPLHF